MKRKTKATILASIASVLLVGVALLRKLRRNWLRRAPYVNNTVERVHYINSILHGSERHCVSQIGMKPIAFHQLCDILTQGEHIRLIVNMSVREQVLIFLHIIGHNVRFHGIGSRFLMQRGRVEAESVTHNYYNSSTKPKFYKNTRLAGKIIEKTSLTNFY